MKKLETIFNHLKNPNSFLSISLVLPVTVLFLIAILFFTEGLSGWIDSFKSEEEVKDFNKIEINNFLIKPVRILNPNEFKQLCEKFFISRNFFKEYREEIQKRSTVDTFDILILSPKHLGFTDEPVITHNMIIRKARDMELCPCPPELMISLLERFDELIPHPHFGLYCVTPPQKSKIQGFEDYETFPFILKNKKGIRLVSQLSSPLWDQGLYSAWTFCKCKKG